MELLITQCMVNGAVYSAQLVLVAIGLTLVYGVMHILNFAHGEMYMAGGYLMWLFFSLLGMNYFLSLGAAIILVALIGIIIERYSLRPFTGNILGSLVVTFGFSLILQTIALLVFGPLDKSNPPFITGVARILGVRISMERVMVFVIGVVFVVALHFFIQRTRLGRAIRAVEQDEEVAALQGVNTGLTRSVCMGIGCSLAAVSGAVMSSVFYIYPTAGSGPVITAFTIIVLGGLGSMLGAIAGGCVIGFTTSFVSTLINPPAATIASFIILILVLLIRPTGILGRK